MVPNPNPDRVSRSAVSGSAVIRDGKRHRGGGVTSHQMMTLSLPTQRARDGRSRSVGGTSRALGRAPAASYAGSQKRCAQ
eukprot:scaffold90944_cov34-Tisochrysis_lutea.AAC.1